MPLSNQELKAMDVDVDNKMDYEIEKERLAYRDPLTPSEKITNDSDSEKIFSPPSYNALPRLIEIHKETTNKVEKNLLQK